MGQFSFWLAGHCGKIGPHILRNWFLHDFPIPSIYPYLPPHSMYHIYLGGPINEEWTGGCFLYALLHSVTVIEVAGSEHTSLDPGCGECIGPGCPTSVRLIPGHYVPIWDIFLFRYSAEDCWYLRKVSSDEHLYPVSPPRETGYSNVLPTPCPISPILCQPRGSGSSCSSVQSSEVRSKKNAWLE